MGRFRVVLGVGVALDALTNDDGSTLKKHSAGNDCRSASNDRKTPSEHQRPTISPLADTDRHHPGAYERENTASCHEAGSSPAWVPVSGVDGHACRPGNADVRLSAQSTFGSSEAELIEPRWKREVARGVATRDRPVPERGLPATQLELSLLSRVYLHQDTRLVSVLLCLHRTRTRRERVLSAPLPCVPQARTTRTTTR